MLLKNLELLFADKVKIPSAYNSFMKEVAAERLL